MEFLLSLHAGTPILLFCNVVYFSVVFSLTSDSFGRYRNALQKSASRYAPALVRMTSLGI